MVRLEAEPATLERRVREREPARWSGLEQLLSAASRLAVTMLSLSGVDLVLSTDDRPREKVAARIRAELSLPA